MPEDKWRPELACPHEVAGAQPHGGALLQGRHAELPRQGALACRFARRLARAVIRSEQLGQSARKRARSKQIHARGTCSRRRTLGAARAQDRRARGGQGAEGAAGIGQSAARGSREGVGGVAVVQLADHGRSEGAALRRGE